MAAEEKNLTVVWKKEILPAENYCTLCIEMVDLDEVIIRLACGHIFHYKCMILTTKLKCPLCRHPIDVPAQIHGFNHPSRPAPPVPPIQIPPVPTPIHRRNRIRIPPHVRPNIPQEIVMGWEEMFNLDDQIDSFP